MLALVLPAEVCSPSNIASFALSLTSRSDEEIKKELMQRIALAGSAQSVNAAPNHSPSLACGVEERRSWRLRTDGRDKERSVEAI